MASIAANSESRISVNSFSLPKLPPLKYFSRRSSNIRTNDLPLEEGAIGAWSLWGVIYAITFATIPLAYVYILLILFREVCRAFPETLLEPLLQAAAQQEGFILPKLVYFMETHSSRLVEVWCIVEGIFFVVLKLQIQYLQCKDTLEASLSAAPLMDMHERAVLWERMMDATDPNTISFLCGWFFDCELEEISKYDVTDFCTWCMFESRQQEHLTSEEMEQLQEFINDVEYRISILLHGTLDEEEVEDDDANDDDSFSSLGLGSAKDDSQKRATLPRRYRPPPKQWFRFPESTSDEEPTFFTNLYENYKRRYERYTLGTAHPVQGFRNFVAEAEENALATASQMYQAAYSSVVSPEMDKQLTAYTHATKVQLQEAWDSCRKDRLEMADFVSNRSTQIRKQLKGYRTLLHRMIQENARVPSQQMAHIMRQITQCNEAMERVEKNAMDGFGTAMGFARRNLPTVRLSSSREPSRYAKYNLDPLLGVATYPLGFHLLVLCGTELPLRIMMRNRGFQRLRVGRVQYYFHPGRQDRTPKRDRDGRSEIGRLPIIFVHGIGVGLIAYMGIIDHFLESGRPILLPEIPYVSGFRPWQSPNAVLSPSVVTSTMVDMLATHGFFRGTFVGHSYGTVWLSYMVKYARQAVAAVCFLDPICFGLHYPRLTKQFVYVRPDPGSISYMVRTDVIVNWTIQRSFPWAWIILFAEQLEHIPCSVFLSESDMLVPAAKVEEYMRNHSFPIRDFEAADAAHFSDKAGINVAVFRGDCHGGWTERPSATSPKIAQCVEILTSRAEEWKES